MTAHLLAQAYECMLRQELGQAQSLLKQALALNAADAEAWSMLGMVHFQHQDLQNAEGCFRKAWSLEPTEFIFGFHLANALRLQGKQTEAIQTLQRVLQQQADFAPAHQVLLSICLEQQKWLQAAQELEHLLNLIPGADDQLQVMTEMFPPRQPGQSTCDNLVRAYPPLVRLFYQLAEVHAARRAYRAACYFYEECLTVGGLPKLPDEICSQIASCYFFNNQPEAAHAYFEQAGALAGQPHAYSLWQAICEPIIYRDTPHLQSVRARQISQLQAALDRLQADLTATGKSQSISLPNLFYLSYQGYNDLEILKRLNVLQPAATRKPRGSNSPQLRIGFVSCSFHHHATTLHLFQTLAFLAAAPDIELRFFHLGQHTDQMTQQLADLGPLQHLFGMANPVPAIEAENLDILVYTDLGIAPLSNLLAGHRLAPVQVALSGHPASTGIPNVDYYISNRLSEPENAQAHYSEKLVLLSTPLCSLQPAPPPLVASKSTLGLDPDGNLYVCPMTLFKIHPDFDEAVAHILSLDPQGHIYFFKFMQSDLHQAWQQRMQARLPASSLARLHLLDWLPEAELHQIILQADVVLDSFHFGGGITSRLALALGTPVITWPGEFYRSRITLGLYRMLGIEDGIAWQQADYAPLAVALATDKPRQQKLRQNILAHLSQLFDDSRAKQDLLDFFRQVGKATQV